MRFQGADINSRNKDQLTPLMSACSKGNTEVVKFLLANGAKIMEVDARSRTALHLAVESRNNEVVEMLMKV